MRISLLTACFAVAAVSAACGPFQAGDEAAPPGVVSAAFDLTRAGNDTLPVTLQARGACRDELTAGSAVFFEGGSYQLTLAVREVCGQWAAEPIRRLEGGRYRIVDTTVRFSPRGGPEEPEATGTLVDATLIVNRVIYGETRNLTFMRREAPPAT
jgi:hypothetical protein